MRKRERKREREREWEGNDMYYLHEVSYALCVHGETFNSNCNLQVMSYINMSTCNSTHFYSHPISITNNKKSKERKTKNKWIKQLKKNENKFKKWKK